MKIIIVFTVNNYIQFSSLLKLIIISIRLIVKGGSAYNKRRGPFGMLRVIG